MESALTESLHATELFAMFFGFVLSAMVVVGICLKQAGTRRRTRSSAPSFLPQHCDRHSVLANIVCNLSILRLLVFCDCGLSIQGADKNYMYILSCGLSVRTDPHRAAGGSPKSYLVSILLYAQLICCMVEPLTSSHHTRQSSPMTAVHHLLVRVSTPKLPETPF